VTAPARRRARPLVLAGLLAAATGCVTPVQKDYAAFRAANPRSILVVPVVNNSTNVDAPGFLVGTLAIPVAERGFYVFPVPMVSRVLEDDGLSDANLLHQADPIRLCGMFGADAVLLVSIDDWSAKYLVLNTTVEVEVNYELKDGKTGQTLWSEHTKKAYSSGQSSSSGSLLADLIVMAVSAAVTKAAPDYMPLARQANAEALATPGRGLPAGPYSPEYGGEASQPR
jgi:hypothetical protein